MSNLSQLTELRLANNDLTGTIPPELGDLSQLQDLYLSENQLEGTIPVEIGNLSRLRTLDLYDNTLSGSVPAVLGNLGSLEFLSLQQNDLSGELPAELGNLDSLYRFVGYENQFSGPIPPELGNLSSLNYLHLGQNQLTGSIPPALGSLDNLESLILRENKLTGTIPSELGNLSNMKDLRLSHNQLTGVVPSTFIDLTVLELLYLQNNRLTSMPDLSGLETLQSIVIEFNSMDFGSIEPNIGVANQFYYSAQDSVGSPTDTTVQAGEEMTLSVAVGGTQNQYQWYKDGQQINGATAASYTIPSILPSDSGAYLCEITNTIATELTLYSYPISVSVVQDPSLLFARLSGLDLTGFIWGDLEWGDYDRDGDLDAAATGYNGSESVLELYRNEGNAEPQFVGVSVSLTGASYGSLDWGDYDGDGDLDLLVTGDAGIKSGISEVNRITRLYRNDGNNSFTSVSTALPDINDSDADWGDYDNDGDLDIALAGQTDTVPITGLYNNLGDGTFRVDPAVFPPLLGAELEWVDFDTDGDLDLFATGWSTDEPSEGKTYLFRNSMGSFTEVTTGITGVGQVPSADWGDYDGDGDPDLLVAGTTTDNTPLTALYRNDGGTFTSVTLPAPAVKEPDVAWTDYDSDGRLDFILMGVTDAGDRITALYRNTGSDQFEEQPVEFPGLRAGSAAWGDYDADGDLDLMLSGEQSGPSMSTAIYQNNTPVKNTPPDAVTNLTSQVELDTVRLSWNTGTDQETSPSALSYNIRISRAPTSSANYALPPMADDSTGTSTPGLRFIAETGNAGENTTRNLIGLPYGTYYWSVQAIDGGFAGGPFASEQTFTLVDLIPPDLAVGILQNPVIDHYFDLYVLASEELGTGPSAEFGGETFTLDPVDEIEGFVYHTVLHTTNTGEQTLTVSGADISGNQTQKNFAFTLARVTSNLASSLTVQGTPLRVAVPPQQIRKQGILSVTTIPRTETRGALSLIYPNLATVPEHYAEVLGFRLTSSAKLQKPYRLEVHGDAANMGSGFFRSGLDGWEALKTYITENQSVLWAYTEEPGVFAVFEGTGAPEIVASKMTLSQNYPNPFSENTTIEYTVPATESLGAQPVKLQVFNLLGERVTTLVSESQVPKQYVTTWDGTNGAGRQVSSGIYFLLLRVRSETLTRKMLLVK